jgi:hypothetical protein
MWMRLGGKLDRKYWKQKSRPNWAAYGLGTFIVRGTLHYPRAIPFSPLFGTAKHGSDPVWPRLRE